jgi:hypothetical protein
MKKVFVTLCVACLTTFSLQAQTPSSKTVKSGTDATPKAKTEATAKPAPGSTGTKAAESKTGAAAAAATTTPESKDYVKFDKVLHDYGTVKKGGNGACQFTYKNTGKEPLIISSCYGSCGCTVPKWPKEPLMPGKTFTIDVNYDTNRQGPFEKTVTVNFQNHTDPTTLKIKGTVEAPPAEVPFGTQPANTGAPLERNN